MKPGICLSSCKLYIDMGSGSIKFGWSSECGLDDPKKIRLSFQKALNVETGQFSPESKAEFRAKFFPIVEEHTPQSVKLFATAVWRQTTDSFLNDFEKELQDIGIKTQFEVIDQHKEGTLAFMSTMWIQNLAPENSIVWDIGGGSMQISFIDSNKDIAVLGLTVASSTFRQAFIQSVAIESDKTQMHEGHYPLTYLPQAKFGCHCESLSLVKRLQPAVFIFQPYDVILINKFTGLHLD